MSDLSELPDFEPEFGGEAHRAAMEHLGGFTPEQIDVMFKVRAELGRIAPDVLADLDLMATQLIFEMAAQRRDQ